MNTHILRMKNPTFRTARNLAMLAGLLTLPLAAQAAPVALFTADNQTITIDNTADTSSVNYAVGNGFNHDTLNIINGGSLSLPTAGATTGYIYVGQLAGNNFNVITIDGAGSSLSTAGGEMRFGYRGSDNTMTISNGGTMTGGSWGNSLGGFGTAQRNTITVTGTGSSWSTGSNINLNGGGSNSVSVLAGGTITNGPAGQLYVGNASGSNTVTVSGTGSLFTQKGLVTVGSLNGIFNNNALMIASGGTMNVTDSGNTGLGIVVNGLSGATGNKVQIDGGTLNVSSATNTNAIDIKKGALVMNSGTVTTERLLANTDTTSVVTFNGGSLTTQGTTVANGAVFTVGNGTSAAAMKLDGGTHSFANGITLANNSTLSGTGTITSGTLVVSSGATLSPGNSPGTLTAVATTLEGGGNYNWQIFDATAAAGTGFDTINLTAGNALTLNNTSGNTFNINLWSLNSITPDANGNALNFDNTLNQSWTLIATDQAISGFAANKFTVNVGAINGTGGFTNALAGGTFTVALGDSGTDLLLTYSTVPEPSTWLLLGLGLTTVAALRRRLHS